ncbi:glycosyltransferase [Pseudodesulfovibrio sp.]|uniref:glycosyltransferase n=1 Tax=Pseudodesulfovibrio sp. TaxID=2035812 RepID=UPI002638C33A|nr:glycosyltransferase [Pseudodesulfovibrio sp.]MDD3312389.1 glycosyltransferase [Pseudodesulfovibrio sp.]
MKINFVNRIYANESGSRHVVRLANLLADMGHEVRLTCTEAFGYDLGEVRAERAYSPLLRDGEVPDADAVVAVSWCVTGKVAALPPSKGAKFAWLEDFGSSTGASEAVIGSWRQPVHLVAASRRLEEAAAAHASRRATCIPCGVDFDLFRPGDRRMPGPDGPVLGGWIEPPPGGGFADLLAVAEILRGRGVPARLKLFGTGPRPDALPADAEYLCRPSRAERAEAMRACHFWLALDGGEGTPVPALEAMACGATPVCADSGGLRDYCLDGETGFLVEAGDAAGAADRISGLLRDPDLWGRLVTNGLDHVRAMGSERENAALFADFLASRAGEAGRAALFDFAAENRNTHATLAAYLACAQSHLERGDADFADSLVAPVVEFYEDRAVDADRPGVLAEHQDNYGLALVLRNRVFGETRRGFLQRAFRYAPDRPGVVESLADAHGRELAFAYRNPARFDGKLRIYLTLACNLNCPYCVNEKTRGVDKRRKPATADAWAEAINREGRPVVFTGGEPFLFRDLPGLVNRIDPRLSVSVYTNLSLDVADQLRAMTREVRFYASWHAHQQPDRDIFLRNARTILDNPRLALTAHAIEAHENQRTLASDVDHFREQGLPIDVDVDQRDFEGCLRDAGRDALCRKRIHLIDPEGDRYQCVSRLMRRDRPMENIFSHPLREDICVDLCPDYGLCAPCDGLGETCMGVLGPGRMAGN